MPEPIPDSTLRRWRRKYDNLDEMIQGLDDNEIFDPIVLMKEAFGAAKCVPKLLDEIDRLKGAGNA